MKSRWITVGLCVVAAVVLIVRLAPHRGRAGSSGVRHGHAGNALMGLRSLVLEGSRANFGLPPGASPTQPFAVVTDWGDAQGATTIVAIADGSASVYYTNGGGSMGGGQAHASIHDAALKTVEAAAAAQPSMQRTTQFPVAKRGQVTFYLVTDSGVYAATAAEEDLSSGRNPLSGLAAAAQSIQAEYKKVEGGP